MRVRFPSPAPRRRAVGIGAAARQTAGMAADVTVTHRPDHRRFEAEVDGHVAELVYRVDGDHLLVLHTGVPGPVEGRGVGGALVRAAAEHAAAADLAVVPLCSFAAAWLRRHPDVAARARVADR
ncbi:MAG TPA: GNAT family N-acetyltransferase [Acidimicrobiales bacterium]